MGILLEPGWHALLRAFPGVLALAPLASGGHACKHERNAAIQATTFKAGGAFFQKMHDAIRHGITLILRGVD
eukprot:scaffold101555_cov20-Tisochrysis_lutea.AAC.1